MDTLPFPGSPLVLSEGLGLCMIVWVSKDVLMLDVSSLVMESGWVLLSGEKCGSQGSCQWIRLGISWFQQFVTTCVSGD